MIDVCRFLAVSNVAFVAYLTAASPAGVAVPALTRIVSIP
jgi:hypothetical protein